MPSSSNRSTGLEICLFYVRAAPPSLPPRTSLTVTQNFRYALARLQGYSNTNYASFTKKCFAEVLDISVPDLQRILNGSWAIW